jgi:PKD repeat protein
LVNDAWPLYDDDTSSSPAAGDIDNDGMLEIVVGPIRDQVHCWELGENTYKPECMPWPMFHHDRFNTGLYGFSVEELKANAHGPYYGLINEYVQFFGSLVGGYPPYSYHWDFGDTYTSEEQNPQHTYTIPGNYTVTLTVTDDAGSNSDDFTFTWIQESNSPPVLELMDGPTHGTIGISYDYIFKAIDPEGASVWYYIDWGDTSNTSWLGPYDSDKQVNFNHTWTKQGTYFIKCKAKDPYNDEGSEKMIEVTMPRNKVKNNVFFWRLLEQFPIFQKLLLFIK